MHHYINSIQTKKEITKNHFTLDEDKRLKNLVAKYSDNDWKLIATYMPGRSARQCRERYIGYLSPSLVFKPWSEDEDNLLIQKLTEIGPKWSKMVPFFEGRSDCNIKNRWYKHLSKKASKSFIESVFNKNERKAVSIAQKPVAFSSQSHSEQTSPGDLMNHNIQNQFDFQKMNQFLQYQYQLMQQNMFFNNYTLQCQNYNQPQFQQPANNTNYTPPQNVVPEQNEITEIGFQPFASDPFDDITSSDGNNDADGYDFCCVDQLTDEYVF